MYCSGKLVCYNFTLFFAPFFSFILPGSVLFWRLWLDWKWMENVLMSRSLYFPISKIVLHCFGFIRIVSTPHTCIAVSIHIESVKKRWEQEIFCVDVIKIVMGKIKHINLLMNFHGGTVIVVRWETFLSCHSYKFFIYCKVSFLVCVSHRCDIYICNEVCSSRSSFQLKFFFVVPVIVKQLNFHSSRLYLS